MSHTLPFIFLLLLLLPGAHPGLSPASTPPISSGEPDPTAQASQMVLVLTPGWDSTTGRLACFERILLGDPWKEVGEPCEINVGRTGLAWGLGLHGGALGDGPVKREGDGRSPAGVFRLSGVYGYAPRDSVRFLRMPYIEATSTCQCIDDPRSAYYNLVLDSLAVVHADWTSRERMHPPKGDWNKWGVVVDHNMSPRTAGRGSCIFLHVTEGRGVPTSGCTSLEEERILALISWLEEGKRPLLVQLPHEEYRRFKPLWRLP